MSTSINNQPAFIELLTPDDQKLYNELHKNVGSPNFRYNRYRRISALKNIFEYIRKYCEYKKEDQWKRYLVCGICQFNNCIAININQLKLLISKSKAVINGALAKMGYHTLPMKSEEYSLLYEKIPFLTGRYSEIKHWTIRKNDSISINQNDEVKNIENKNFDESDEIINNNETDENNLNDELDKNKQNETEFSFINFTTNKNDDSSDLDFDFMNSDVYVLMTNSDFDINISDIEDAMINSKSCC